MPYFDLTLFLKDEKRRQILRSQIEDSLLVWKIGSCEHITNDLPTFSPQKRNLEIGPPECLLPILEPRIGSLKSDRVNGRLVISTFVELLEVPPGEQTDFTEIIDSVEF